MRRALLIGIDDYPFGALAGCVNDAKNVAALLERHYDGSPNFSCKMMLSPGGNVTRAAIRSEVQALFATACDFAVFYFSGHGTENNLGGYVVSHDAAAYDQGVAMADIIQLANAATSISEIAIVLDCCHSGHLGNIPALGAQNQSATLREGVSILTASRSSQVAVEIAGQGLFTRLFCDALSGVASDITGEVNIAGIYSHISRALGPWDQRPLYKSHVARLLSIRKTRPKIDLAALRRINELFPTSNSVLHLTPAYESTEPAAEPDKVELFGVLQAYRDCGLLVPISESALYYAAVRSGGCKLTPLGEYYWQLVSGNSV